MRKRLEIAARVSRTDARWFLPWRVLIVDWSSGVDQVLGEYFTWTEKGAIKLGHKELAKLKRRFDRTQAPRLSIYENGEVREDER